MRSELVMKSELYKIPQNKNETKLGDTCKTSTEKNMPNNDYSIMLFFNEVILGLSQSLYIYIYTLT